MIKKTKLWAILGITFIVNAAVCIIAFAATYKEKKKLSAAFWSLAVALGAAGAALVAVYASKENVRIRDLRRALSEKDHWFHSFEYPECAEPDVSIDDSYFPPVETEDEEMPF